MQDEMKVISVIAPDLMADIGRRAQVLTGIESMQPVGRRALAARLNLPEREVRAAAAMLKDQGLITMDAAGMQLTNKALSILPAARDLSRDMAGLSHLEQALSRLLSVPHVMVVSGNADQDAQTLRDVGRAAAHRIHKLVQNGITMAVAGGSTMREVARGMQANLPIDVMVIPARGGMGSSVDTQANTIAAEMAGKLGGRHQSIHLPDNLDSNALQEMLKVPEVAEAIPLIQNSALIVHGISRADIMAQQRRLSPEAVETLRRKKAVGEAFGDFFDFTGRTVWQASTVSAAIPHQNPASKMVAVAAGERKAEAIIGSLRHDAHDTLITDEGAARRIIALMEENQNTGT